MEAALVFPILLTLLLGVFEMGNAILVNQKIIRASQVTADLVAREKTVSVADISEAVEAGTLALVPFDTGNYGVDIVSISFDEDSVAEIVWRETVNMTESPNVLDRVTALAEPYGGAIVVISQYFFEPVFVGFITNEILMEEVAFSRGRSSSVVNLE